MDRCPHIKTLRAGDESMDYCTEADRISGRMKVCHLVSGDTCEEWEEIQKEWAKEAQE